MERRILGMVLGLAHFFIATVVVAVAGGVIWGLFAILAPASGPVSDWTTALPFLAMFLLLVVWWLALLVWALVVQKKITVAAMEGRHAEANERVRRFRDNETLLRLLGLNGNIWHRAAVVEANAHMLNGLHREAIAVALPESKGLPLPLKRAAALIAAASASDSGNEAVLAELRPWFDRAQASPRRPFSQQLLAVEGVSFASQLRLADAEKRAEWLLSVNPRSRLALTLRAQVRGLKGDFAGALADHEAAAALVPPKASEAQRVFLRQIKDTSRCALLRETGQLEEALALVRRIAQEGPRHRSCAVAIPAVEGQAAAARGDAAGTEAALAALRTIEAAAEFDPIARGRVALAIARIERARGAPERAVAALPPAIAAPLAALRQEALMQQAFAKAEAGDTAGARASCEWVLQLSKETVHAVRARAMLEGAPGV